MKLGEIRSCTMMLNCLIKSYNLHELPWWTAIVPFSWFLMHACVKGNASYLRNNQMMFYSANVWWTRLHAEVTESKFVCFWEWISLSYSGKIINEEHDARHQTIFEEHREKYFLNSSTDRARTGLRGLAPGPINFRGPPIMWLIFLNQVFYK